MPSRTTTNHSIKLWLWLKGLKPAKQKVDIPTLLTVLAITLPLDAFLYWRLFCEHFKTEYFTFCYSIEDIAYILYYKGTFFWYVIIILAIPVIPLIFNIPKFIKIIAIAVLTLVVGLGLGEIGKFDIPRIIAYGALVLFVNACIYFFNRNFLYTYTLLIGFFFVMSAEADANDAKKHPIKASIISKAGNIIVNKEDSTRIYVGSTSKFILIYDKNKKILDKFERDSIF